MKALVGDVLGDDREHGELGGLARALLREHAVRRDLPLELGGAAVDTCSRSKVGSGVGAPGGGRPPHAARAASTWSSVGVRSAKALAPASRASTRSAWST